MGVKNEEELMRWADKLIALGIRFRTFREPDRDNETTALACVNGKGLFDELRPI